MGEFWGKFKEALAFGLGSGLGLFLTIVVGITLLGKLVGP